VVIDVPLTLIRTIASFSRVSLATCFLIALYLVHSADYLVVGIQDHGFDPDHEIKYFAFGRNVIQSISVQAFAYHCHPTVGPTMAQFANPTQERQYKLMAGVVGAAACCYVIGGLLPYLTLVDEIDDFVIFSCYPTGRVFTIVTKILYSLFLLITTPLVLYSARLSLSGLVKNVTNFDMSPIIWDLTGLGLLTLVAVLAVVVTSIPVMFDFIGGVSISIILYVFPSIYYLKLCRGDNRVKTVLAWVMFPLGAATLVVCLYDSITRLLEGD
jgi:sodium-coupled neutral amino acid transporter 6